MVHSAEPYFKFPHNLVHPIALRNEIGWANEQCDVPTSSEQYNSQSCHIVYFFFERAGTLRFAHPTFAHFSNKKSEDIKIT